MFGFGKWEVNDGGKCWEAWSPSSSWGDFQGLDVREGRPKCWGRNIADFSVAMHGPTVSRWNCPPAGGAPSGVGELAQGNLQ